MNDSSQASDDHIARLRALDTCAVSDALDRHGLAGVAYGISRSSGSGRIAGRVLTMRLGPADGTPSSRHLGTQAVEAAGPGEVIVVEHRSTTACAGWGGILSFAARQRGIEGVVVDGMCRDIDEAIELGFPVFARGTVPATARGRVREIEFQQPVTISGVPVCPGDFIVADGSGVVFIPAAHVGAVLDTAEMLQQREAQMIAAIRAGASVGDVMNHRYETMLKASHD